ARTSDLVVHHPRDRDRAGRSPRRRRARLPLRRPALDRPQLTPISGWGARIRTWDRGTKTRCLTTWLRPNACRLILAERASPECAAVAPPPKGGAAALRPRQLTLP